MLRFYARLHDNHLSIDTEFAHKCATRIYICIYAIYEYIARLTSRTINQLADFQRGETARLHFEGRILGRTEKEKKRKKEEKKEREEGKVRISIYRGVGGLLNFIWSEWSRFSLSRCYGLSMQVRLVIFMAFGFGYLQTARVRIPFNPDKSFSCPEIAL